MGSEDMKLVWRADPAHDGVRKNSRVYPGAPRRVAREVPRLLGAEARCWRNVELQLQYTAYSEFNGASKSYDGNGSDASDNDTM